jgi:hypothetical protein
MPALDDRYPTIGNAIQIVAPAYEGNSTYIGKFHLANYSGSLTGGTNPYAPYGFGYNYYQSPTMPPHGLPLTYLYPSPIGYPNEGEQAAGGGGYPLPPSTPTAYNMSDPDIVNAFVQWFEARPKANPWLTVVGLVNPHDVQFYPNGYHNYKAITSFPATYPPEVTPLSAYTSFPFTTEDVASPSVAALKPGLQSYFLNFGNTQYGAVGAVEGSSWTDFMNYYLAVIANVDASVGVILNNVTVAANERAACPSPTGDLNNTVVIFTSDHADYAGAHGLHGKGGAVYEEALRVPLYVHFPNQRNQHCGGNYAGFQRNQLTSSVDLFALIMDLGTTGTSQWRTEYFPDQKARQSLYYYLYHPNATETRIIPATGSLIDGFPYVVTTTDEDFGLKGNPGSVWRHVACLRTKSPTTQPNGSDSPPNANLMGLTNPAKLATYNLWDQDNPANEAGSVTQYEFYDYVNAGNTRELLNDSEKTSPTVVSGTGASQTLLTDMVNALGSEYVGVAATGLFATELNSALTGQAVKLSATGQWEIDSGTDLATVQSDATSNYETYEHS